MFKKLVLRFSMNLSQTSFEREYKEARRLDTVSALRTLLIHAYDNVPYYQNVLGRTNVVKNGKVNLANLDQVTILTKQMIRRQTSKFISRDCEKRKWFYNTSAGSTGEPIKLIQDRLSHKWAHATTKFYYRDMLGIEETSARKVLLWGPRRNSSSGRAHFGNRVTDTLTNTIYVDTFCISEADMRRFVRIINSYKPEIIRGYAGSLYELCRFVERKGLSIFSPKIVVSTAETLHNVMREKIENVFGTKVFNFYGSRETHGIAGECRYGLLHIFLFNNYLEVLNENNQRCQEGASGRVIATTLHNLSMPLIRYDVGDMAIVGPEKCKCGTALPTLRKIIGRQIDYFPKEDGSIVYGGYFIELMWAKDWIKAFKVIQEDYKEFRILVVLRDRILDEHDRRDIEERIRFVMGRDCRVKWEVVDQIPKTKSGKHLHAQSLLRVP